MRNLRPHAPNAGEPLPDFTPVERKYRHDGWTPTRQRAFIAALADTGSVSRAAALVNMSPEGAYYLRRQKGAESFRRAWEAALDFGVQRLKDIAFERAIEGELVPVMSFGRLVGYRRKTNDRLLMFCLRMNARTPDGTRLHPTIATSRSSPSRGGGPAQLVEGSAPLPLGREEGSRRRRRKGEGLSSSTKPSRTPTLSQPLTPTPQEQTDDQADLIRSFDPVALSLPEIEALQALLAEAAATRRAEATHPALDPRIVYLPEADAGQVLEMPFADDETGGYFRAEGEICWQNLDPAGLERQAEIDAAVAEVAAMPPRTPEQEEADFMALVEDHRRAGNHAIADDMEARWRARRRDAAPPSRRRRDPGPS